MTAGTRESTLLAELGAALPDDAVVVDPVSLEAYRHDRAGGVEAGVPQVVVRPSTTAQVSAVLAAAHARGVPVVPRGAGSGLAGGANAIDGCIVLSTERMNQVVDVHVDDGYAVVEPGVLNQQLRDHVARSGLWYAPDPGSKDFCSIGGNIGTNSGGMCCVKYGVTRDAVLGLEVVLADGTVTRLGHRTAKGVAGYDLAGLVVGSEGTLAVVTQAWLRLRPLPPPPTTVVAVFADLPSAGRAIERSTVVATPSLLEIMDRATVAAVEAFQPMGLDLAAGALVIGQSDLPGSAGAHEAALVAQECERAGATEVYISEDPQQADMLVAARRVAVTAVEQLGVSELDDVAVPRSRLPEAMARFTELAERYDVLICTFGHGDGNLHPTVVHPRGDEEAAVRASAAFEAILDVALDLGGTVTGEHGVGLLKRRKLGVELDPAAQSLHEAVKRAWDPQGILNPGKALPVR
ncbi:MAG: FAD-binding oxidoreductase [Actinomycetes bacterium]